VIIQKKPLVSCNAFGSQPTSRRSFCDAAKHSTQSIVRTCGEAQMIETTTAESSDAAHIHMLMHKRLEKYCKCRRLPDCRKDVPNMTTGILRSLLHIRCLPDTKGNYQHFTLSNRQQIKQQLCHRPWPKSMADKGLELEKAGILAPSSWGDDPGTGSDTNRASTRCICNMQVRGIVL
jgi:hypothetical protein